MLVIHTYTLAFTKQQQTNKRKGKISILVHFKNILQQNRISVFNFGLNDTQQSDVRQIA